VIDDVRISNALRSIDGLPGGPLARRVRGAEGEVDSAVDDELTNEDTLGKKKEPSGALSAVPNVSADGKMGSCACDDKPLRENKIGDGR